MNLQELHDHYMDAEEQYHQALTEAEGDPGYNPIRWKCKEHGCFNTYSRPLIELFADCFPRSISFGDGDGKVEIKGHLLFLEWKEKKCEIPVGQATMYQRVTVGKAIGCLCAAGKVYPYMEVTHHAWFWDGHWLDWRESSLLILKERIRGWVRWAEGDKVDWTALRKKSNDYAVPLIL
jgi:hypothetical protein